MQNVTPLDPHNIKENNTHFCSSGQQHPNIVNISSLDLNYKTQKAIDQLSLTLPKGEILAILGPNGAGKTSLINIMLGLKKPSAGQIQVFGQTPGHLSVKQKTGVMLQHAELADNLRVREIIQSFRAYYPEPLSLESLLRSAGLQHKKDHYYGKLSGGEKRRVQFAIALAGNPKLIFLDEPTTGLDPEARQSFWETIRTSAKNGQSVILTTHYIEEADQLADRVIVLQQGKIIADATPSAIKSLVKHRQLKCITSLNHEHPFIQKLINNSQVKDFSHTAYSSHYKLTLLSSDIERITHELLTLDSEVSELEIQSANLEQAFLAITQAATSNH